MRNFKKSTIGLLGLIAFSVLLSSCGSVKHAHNQTPSVPKPKNIIFFIGDGMGYNHVLATNYFVYGEAPAQPYEMEGWTQLALSTYPAIISYRDGQKIFSDGYSPNRAWSDAEYVSLGYTDSGAGGTALATGRKTFNNSIGIGPTGDTLVQVTASAEALGKATGIVSSVHMNHATPASFAAHNQSRRNLMEIARYMLFNTSIDLIMTTGHPYADDIGQVARGDDRFVGGRELWRMMEATSTATEFQVDGEVLRVKDADGDGVPDPWTVIDTRAEFRGLASGPTPKRVLGIAMANSTLQQARLTPPRPVLPFEEPFNESVPTLAEMTQSALNVLSKDPDGFFVMIEGGAIDWAGHDNDLTRIIEEQHDFNQAIKEAIRWVEANSSWEETLIIVTSDHETGHLTGPDHPENINSPVVNKGKGNMPGHKFNSDDHTNKLVPFYAKGIGQKVFEIMAGGYDPVRGFYLQNVQVPQAIFLMWGKPQNAAIRSAN
ncbi:MAG TPA: alkaline phosphatase [Bacteroidales bacterium]|nr:alkaline phosphatase [Bacteroidales bacterium]